MRWVSLTKASPCLYRHGALTYPSPTPSLAPESSTAQPPLLQMSPAEGSARRGARWVKGRGWKTPLLDLAVQAHLSSPAPSLKARIVDGEAEAAADVTSSRVREARSIPNSSGAWCGSPGRSATAKV